MSPTDLSDLSATTLSYLANGCGPGQNWTGLFRPGERVRLRCINGAGHTFYDVRIPGHQLTVVQMDGQLVEPVTVDEFRFGPGQTCDVLVQPTQDACTVFAQSMDRTGYARATLAVRPGRTAPVPPLDPVQPLSMADMMGDMAGGGMGHSGMGHGMNHGAMTQGSMSGAAMARGAMDHATMNHAGMNHAAMGHGDASPAASATAAQPPAIPSPSPASKCATRAPSGPTPPTCASTPRAPTWTTLARACAATAAACSPWPTCAPSAARWMRAAPGAR